MPWNDINLWVDAAFPVFLIYLLFWNIFIYYYFLMLFQIFEILYNGVNSQNHKK